MNDAKQLSPDFRHISATRGINLALVREWELDVSWPRDMTRAEAERAGKLQPCVRITYLDGDRKIFRNEECVAVMQQIEQSDRTQHVSTDHTHCRECNVAIDLGETLCAGCMRKKLEAAGYQQ